MPTITAEVGGVSHTLTVPDAFLKLPQNEQIAAITQALPHDTSFGSALQYGVHNALAGLGDTAQIAGQELGSPTLQSIGKGVSGLVPTPQDYQAESPEIGKAILHGHILRALEGLPRAAVEQAPGLLAPLAGAAVGSLAGPAGTVAGAMAGSGLSTFGPNVESREAANGDKTPTTGDLVAAGLTSLAQGGLQAAGLGKVPGVSSVVANAPRFFRPVVEGGLEALGGGAAEGAREIGTTAGTNQGTTLDPSAIVGAGVSSGAARGLQAGLREGAVSTRNGAVNATAGLFGKPDTAEAPAIVNVVNDAKATREALPSAARAQLSDANILNTLGQTYDGLLAPFAKKLLENNVIDRDTYANVIMPAIDAAQRHNKTVGVSSEPDPALLTAFSRIKALDIPDQFKQPLLNALAARDQLSRGARLNRGMGPVEAATRKVTPLVGFGLGALSGNPLDAMAGLAFGGNRTGAGALHGVARLADRVLGTQRPLPIMQSRAAAKIVSDNNLPVPDSLSDLRNGLATLSDPMETQRIMLGLPPGSSLTGHPSVVGIDPKTGVGVTQAQIDALGVPKSPAARVALQQKQQQLAQVLEAQRQEAIRNAQEIVQNRASAWRAKQAAAAAVDQNKQQAAQQAAQARHAALKEKQATAAERVEDQLSGMLYKRNPDAQINRANGISGAAALGASDPASIFARTNGMRGSPLNPSAVDATGAPVTLGGRVPGMDDQPEGPITSPAAAVIAASVRRSRRGSPKPEAQPAAQPTAQTAPVYSPGVAQGVTPGGWSTYILRGLRERTGLHATIGDVHHALNTLVDAGVFPKDIAAHLKNSNAQANPEILEPIMAQVAHENGLGDALIRRDQPAQGAASAADPLGPIRSPQRYQNAVTQRTAYKDSLAAQARKDGHDNVAMEVEKIGTMASKADREAERSKFIKALWKQGKAGRAEAAYAASLLNPTFMAHGH